METAINFAPAAWIITGASLLFTGGVGFSLVYHWFRFGTNRLVALFALVVYTVVSLSFLALLAALAAAM